jgi:hypothetical protein
MPFKFDITPDRRPVCGDCRETMVCNKNDIQVDCGNGYVKNGDQYECPECYYKVITGFGNLWMPSRPLETYSESQLLEKD